MDALTLVREQAEDDGLWFRAQTASEAYLQQELRRLHAVVEADLGSSADEGRMPMQPVVVAPDGCVRFLQNRIVRDLLEHGQKTGLGLNELACGDYYADERMQLAQLLGYSVSGYGGLSYVSAESCALADERARSLTPSPAAPTSPEDAYAEGRADELEDCKPMLAWAYSKLHHVSFTKQDDALMLDQIKLLLEHGIHG